MIFSLLLIAANLLPNGSFDQGTAAPFTGNAPTDSPRSGVPNPGADES